MNRLFHSKNLFVYYQYGTSGPQFLLLFASSLPLQLGFEKLFTGDDFSSIVKSGVLVASVCIIPLFLFNLHNP